MKNIILTIILISSQITWGIGQNKFTVEVQNDVVGNYFGIDDFYFVHQIFADAFYMTDLHKQLNYDEMTSILRAIQNGVTLTEKVTVNVPQKKGIDAKLVFFAKDHPEDGKMFVMLTNFNKSTRSFDELDEKESLVRWYFIRENKLVYRKDLFTESEEQKKKKGKPHKLIDYYFFDDNAKNDSQVKELIDDLLNSEESRIEQLYGRLYLGEYWLSEGNLEKAEHALHDLKEFFENEQEIPRNYILIINMATTEFEIMKRIKT